MKKALVLYSGGLDSRLAVKILSELELKVTALYFKLPFGCNCSINNSKFFTKKSNIKLKIIDATKGKYLKEYIEVLKNPKYGRGKGINPCVDCKIWMFKIAKKIFIKNKFNVFATGEVLNQRPMSQTENRKKLIDKEVGIDILRPLSAQLFPETIYEREKIVNRDKLYAINGRRRIKQMELAEKFKIDYPEPAGGCILCEKLLKNRFDYLLKNNILNSKNIELVKIGRHFIIDNNWYIVARNEYEGEIIERYKEHFLRGECNSPTVYFNKKDINKYSKLLQKAFSSRNSEKERKKFDEYKL
jgi:predicted subunit of tRNA(5-methylaminomethyl-2-thiouridylate) methyltransferase